MLLLAGVGGLILLVAWLPMVLKELPLSLPMVCVAIGYGVFSLSSGTVPDPRQFPRATEGLTEIIVIVALTGAGLKLDRPFAWRSWGATWRLLAIAMPLSIAGIALLGQAMLGLALPAALLLGAALAPTDPVLAADVQVGPPRSGEEDEVRFTLTAEAGLNDGLAFPFVNLAIALALAAEEGQPWLRPWLEHDLAWKLGCGLVLGYGIGRGLGWLTFRMPNRAKLSRTGDGFVALGATFVSYGVTQLAGGYGFLAVFVAALAMRAAERQHAYHERLHDFAEQTERLLMMVLLVLFGGAIAGGLLAPLDGPEVAMALLCLFLVRPAAGLLSCLGSRLPWEERAAVSFFGIRGLGSVYYLAFALNAAPFTEGERLWAVLGLTVLVSIALHGATVTPAMRWLDRRRRRQGVLELGA
ncbi:cation:proton antiporter [Siccirubricoccus sp. KC 17139]|uniref:Cation:proton antiporter n=1 Tax=Siccirubricoccus soli TaxID=2899147 RepID=A0ABT1DA89_9PROT|nr:cation:proton antiporter [Siccirubricoccus soli]MCO6418854.1 cation:proton antiporter [Siccirubricoccus soli]MCP2684989.1 cation:proton antiporter [Siccirubricoccus soli]